MEILTLGAGQEVGRSCIIASICDKTIMFDCGMHMGYSDYRKFPDFTCLSKTGDFNHVLDCIVISHFHLDHCGALPYFTEILGFNGPIYMTYPTRAVLPILLEDCSRILRMKDREERAYSTVDIENCMKKIVPIHMNETYEIAPGYTLTPYYAGHVIGAAMFYLYAKGRTVVYTGDYNTSADRHLGAAKIDCLRPDVLITESTYGGVVRDCRRIKERQFLQLIHTCIKRNGTALIPIFALGRAQELCLLVETYWERMGWCIPVYFAGGLTEKVNQIYKRFISYTSDSAKSQISEHNIFEFKCIFPYERDVELNSPCVIFSSPAMLHSGHSLRIFKNICEDPKNLVILPGYCVRGTVGEKVLSGARELVILGEQKHIRLQVENLAFSAHSDTPGILSIVSQCQPRSIMLVHGDKSRMKVLKKILQDKYDAAVYMPCNGTITTIPDTRDVSLKIEKKILERHIDSGKSRHEFNKRLRIQKVQGEGIITEVQEYLCDLDKQPARD